ncbi:MAG: RIP metalloprotease RseP [Methylophilaceae bacterium]
MLTLITFILTISIIVLVHEFGHYCVARFFNIEVDNFSIGFGKVLLKKKIKGTEFCLRAIPLGGFVAFSQAIKEKSNIAFEDAKLFQRSLVILAGPLINFIFAFLLIVVIVSGTQQRIIPTLTHIEDNSFAESIGMKEGDVLTYINGDPVLSVTEIQRAYKEELLQSIQLNREGKNLSLLIPDKSIDDMGLYFFPNKQNSVLVKAVLEDMPAKLANINPGSIISFINEKEVLSVEGAVDIIKNSPNKEIVITSLLNGKTQTHTITPIIQDKKGIVGMELKSNMDYKYHIKSFKYNTLEIIPQSIYKMIMVTNTIIDALWKIVTGKISLDNLAGPISIANYSYDSVNAGLISFLSFLIILNINVGLINLLPIPTLDGGHLLFYCIEFFTGKRVEGKKMLISQQLGVIFLLLIFLIAVYNDILKL